MERLVGDNKRCRLGLPLTRAQLLSLEEDIIIDDEPVTVNDLHT